MYYTEIVSGGAHNRNNNFVHLNDNQSNFDLDCFGVDVVDAFHSVYKYTEKPTVLAKYNKPVGADSLFWDIDNTSLDVALQDTKTMVSRLLYMGIYPQHIHVYFSGNKGFHIVVPSQRLVDVGATQHIPTIVCNVCAGIAAGLSSFDRMVYDRTRIFRMANSRHSKTHNYKTGITCDHVNSLSIGEIVSMSQTQHNKPSSWVLEPMSNDELDAAIDEAVKNVTSVVPKKNTKFSFNEIEQGIQYGFAEGKRNSGLTTLAGVLHNKNIGKNFAIAFLHSVNEKSSPPLEEHNIKTIVDSVYSYPVIGHTDITDKDIITIKDASDQYVTLRNRTGKLNTGFTHIDKSLTYFDPGEVLIITGRSGIGKTTLGMQFVNQLAKSVGGYGLFVSLEMPSPSLFLRAATITTNSTGREALGIEAISKLILDEPSKIIEVCDAWDRLLIVDKDSLTMEQIEQCYYMAEQKYGHVCAVCIDYGGLVRGADDYQKISQIARGMKTLAKRTHARIIPVVQMSRLAGDGTVEVKMHHLRDTGAWEEGADYIIAGWLSKYDAGRIHFKMLKNRWQERDSRFDIINSGLSYTTTDYVGDTQTHDDPF